MSKNKILTILLCLLSLLSCKQIDTNIVQRDTNTTATYIQNTEGIVIDYSYMKLIDYFYEQVPELIDYEKFINKKSNGKASFFINKIYGSTGHDLEKVYDNNGKYLGNFYLIYFGEKRSDH